MVGKRIYFRNKKITLIQQKIYLESMFPGSETKIKRNTLKWHGKVMPTQLSETYNVSINYTLGKPPGSWVSGENLKKLDSPDFPHNFEINKYKKIVRMCLYYFKYKEWNPNEYLSETIIPWAIEWLFYYEVWLATGQWRGGGIHPNNKKKII